VHNQIEEFLWAHKPDLIAVSTSAGPQAKGMKRFLEDITADVASARRRQREHALASGMVDEDDDDDDDDEAAPVLHVVDTVASIFAASARSTLEFPDYQVGLRWLQVV